MNIPRKSKVSFGLGLTGIATLALGLACGGGGSNATLTSTPMGTTNVLVTDAPSDNWSTVQVQVTDVILVNQADQSQTSAFHGAATVNLVDLDSVGDLLANAQVPVGIYDKVIVKVNTDPTTMTLIPEGSPTAVLPSTIRVVGGGIFTVSLSPVLNVTATGSNAVQVDFDLNHPMFINQTARGTVINFQVKHKPNPTLLHLIQLHRNLGTVTSTSGASLLMHTQYGRDLTFTTDSSTLFYDADTHPFTAGSFSGLVPAEAVMVASRLQDDGSLYAVRVWYCSAANAANLPAWSPEGHVVSVGSNKMVVDNADGHPRTIFIDNSTSITYQNTATLTNETAGVPPTDGQAILAADMRHGFKVSVALADPLAANLHATAVNIERAVDSGAIASSIPTVSMTYGQPLLANLRTYPYSPAFSWWYYEQPSAASTDTTAFNAALLGADGTRVNGVSDLVWNSTTPAWNANNAIMLPVSLPVATITTAYTTATGTMAIAYTDPVTLSPVTKTVALSTATGGGQTVVMKVGTDVAATGLDAPTQWATDLIPSALAVWVSVVPEASGNLAAYSVVVVPAN